MSRAWMAYDAGDAPLGTELADRAARLKEQFNEQFWMPDRGYCAIALDGKKRQVDACASNMGHCLWVGTAAGTVATITPDGARGPVATATLSMLVSVMHHPDTKDRLVREQWWDLCERFMGTGLTGRPSGCSASETRVAN